MKAKLLSWLHMMLFASVFFEFEVLGVSGEEK